jgi:biopolymer transport protein ExbD
MRRKTFSRSSIELELFPFLSVLACTIGSLILLIIVVTTQTLSNEKQVKIIAKTEVGENQTKQPRYLECNQEGIIIYPQKTFVSKYNLNNDYSPLSELISEIQQKSDQEYLIVIIRPTGIEVFKEVRNIIEEAGIDIGYEPLNEGWELKIEP